jgi:tubulin polyglutamylase TTLL6/13
VNKENPRFIENTGANEERAHKRGTTTVFAQMASLGVDVDALQWRIDEIIELTLLAVQQEYIDDYKRTVKTQDERSRLFEILGFDILIDEDLNPWLIEVNNNASLIGDSPFDERIKISVVKGALEIINLDHSFKRRVMARRSGKSLSSLFDGRKESERSYATNWRQLLPAEGSNPRSELFQTVSRLVRPKH